MVGKKTTCILQKKIETQGAGGGWSPSYSRIAEFKAVFFPLTAQEKLYLDKRSVLAAYKLMIPYNAVNSGDMDELDETNRIKIASIEYNVTSVTEHTAGPGKHWQMMLRTVE